jgi:hypothetical protein
VQRTNRWIDEDDGDEDDEDDEDGKIENEEKETCQLFLIGECLSGNTHTSPSPWQTVRRLPCVAALTALISPGW